MRVINSLGVLLASIATLVAALPVNDTLANPMAALERRRIGHLPISWNCGGRWRKVPAGLAELGHDDLVQNHPSDDWSVKAHSCNAIWYWAGFVIFGICNDVREPLLNRQKHEGRVYSKRRRKVKDAADGKQNDFEKSGPWEYITERTLDVIFLCGGKGDAAGQAFYPDKTNIIVRKPDGP
ncbi:hypothetical protein MRB53_042358 [Persea americana]|nr:hypothetical protein MRB53_042358 [Persea americana]